jgi:lipopolysaccharide assembly protein A
MRWFQIAVVGVLGLATLILVLQNFHGVTFSFLNFSLTMPAAVLIVLVYVMGALTGGSLWDLIRWATARERTPQF